MSFDNCFKCFTWWHILTITEATELKLDYYDNVTKAEGAVDYCCSLLIGSPRSVTDKLRRVLNAAAHIITNSSKYDSGLSRTLHHDLHWLDVTERIQFRVAATVYQCLHGMAPAYLAELCLPITASASRRGGLQSATTSNLVIPRCRLSTYGTRAFSVAGPVCWNSLPDYLKSSDLSFDCFRQQLKTFLFCKYWHQSQHYFSALETLLMRSTNSWYLLTFLLTS